MNLNERKLIKSGNDYSIMLEVKFAECKLVSNNVNQFLSILPYIEMHRPSTTVKYCKRVAIAGDKDFDVSWCEGWLQEYEKKKKIERDARQKLKLKLKSKEKEKDKSKDKEKDKTKSK